MILEEGKVHFVDGRAGRQNNTLFSLVKITEQEDPSIIGKVERDAPTISFLCRIIGKLQGCVMHGSGAYQARGIRGLS
jgi:hypothetical protein